MAVERRGPFWDMIEGRLPAPPAARLLGWKLEHIDPESGSIRVQFEGKREFLNPVGSIQGGILAAMLDDTLGPAAAAALGGDAFAQTLELKTSFLRPARPGPLFGDARVVHRGRDIVFLEGSLSSADGTVVATATATARVIPFQPLRSSV
ncbi:MAG TPA: PaaI family thioesterase [Methylomirabilota bacterium]|nr:PaaI family thioesterase [Methylomirabilota bacterium]